MSLLRLNRKQVALTMAFAVAAAVLAVWFWRHRESGLPQMESSRADAKQSDLSSANDIASATFTHAELPPFASLLQGQGLPYEFSWSLSMSSAEGSAILKFRAKLTISKEDQSAEDHSLRLQFSDVAIERAEPEDHREPFQKALAGFGSPFVGVFGSSGALKEVRMRPECPEPTANIVRSFLTQLQIVQRGDHPRNWTAVETDPTGTYQSAYAWRTGAQLGRTKLGYLQPDSQVDSGGSQAAFTFSRDGQLEKFHATDKTKGDVNGSELAVTGFTELRLTSVVPFRVESTAGSWRTIGVNESISSVAQAEEQVSQVPSRELIQKLLSIDRADEKGRWGVMAELSGRLRASDHEVADAVASVADTSEDKDAGMVIGALAEANTRASVSGLGEIARNDSIAVARRQSAIMHLGLLDEPNGHTVDELKELTANPDLPEDLTRATYLALGSATRRAKDAMLSDQEKARVSADLATQLRSAKSTADSRLYISAIGNAGPPNAATLLAAELASPNEAIRGAAVFALRHVSSVEAENLLSLTATNDPSELVRTKAVSAFGYRDTWSAATVQLFHTLLSTEQSAVVTIAAIGASGNQLRTYPELAGDVAALGESSNPDVVEAVEVWEPQLIAALAGNQNK